MSSNPEWIHLTTGKEFSRLLYTNPVCLLCTVDFGKIASDKATVHTEIKAEERTSTGSTPRTAAKQNVMVLSWLTPTNNEGRFMFSINKSRYSASLLAPDDTPDALHKFGVEFSLCVPVKGMEEMVLNVGSISGRHCCKFQAFLSDEKREETNSSELSHRKEKKLKRGHLSKHGIRGLIPIPLGCSQTAESIATSHQSDLFAIQGTVAHLHCRTYGVTATPALDPSYSIDGKHLLVLAEVIDAYVQPPYWDSKKLLFCPQATEVPPYLTFFGTQTFGYVTAQIT
jgi:flavin reductase (DIM6/NTAB) family NADH-FMN oxidoreductase RutF